MNDNVKMQNDPRFLPLVQDLARLGQILAQNQRVRPYRKDEALPPPIADPLEDIDQTTKVMMMCDGLFSIIAITRVR